MGKLIMRIVDFGKRQWPKCVHGSGVKAMLKRVK
jgi:hypothetical protein